MRYWRHDKSSPPQPRSYPKGNGSAKNESRAIFQEALVRAQGWKQAWHQWSHSPRMEGGMGKERGTRPPCRTLRQSISAFSEEGKVCTEAYPRRSLKAWLLGRLLDTEASHPRSEKLDRNSIRRPQYLTCNEKTRILMSKACEAGTGTRRKSDQGVAKRDVGHG